jgi:hypothetical protein
MSEFKKLRVWHFAHALILNNRIASSISGTRYAALRNQMDRAAMSVGANIVEGIKTGIFNAWSGFTNWMMNLLGTMIDAIKAYFGISSPSKVMADLIGTPLVQGIQAGWDRAMPSLTTRVMDSMKGLTSGLQGTVSIGLDGGGGNRSILPTDGDMGGLTRGGGGGFGRGGGGLHINGPITIQAGLGASGGQIAQDFLDELNAQLALTTRTRRGF